MSTDLNNKSFVWLKTIDFVWPRTPLDHSFFSDFQLNLFSHKEFSTLESKFQSKLKSKTHSNGSFTTKYNNRSGIFVIKFVFTSRSSSSVNWNSSSFSLYKYSYNRTQKKTLRSTFDREKKKNLVFVTELNHFQSISERELLKNLLRLKCR